VCKPDRLCSNTTYDHDKKPSAPSKSLILPAEKAGVEVGAGALVEAALSKEERLEKERRLEYHQGLRSRVGSRCDLKIPMAWHP